MRSFSAWKRWNRSWERGNPLLPKRGFSPSQTSQGKALLTEFSCGKLALIPFAFCRGIFALQKYFRSLTRHVFDFQKNFYCFPGTFSTFKNTFVLSLVQFWLSKVFSLLPRRVFSVQKYFCCFPGVFSAFKSTFAPCPTRFRASKILSLLPRRVFCVQKYFRGLPGVFSCFKSTFFIRFKQKSIH